MAVLDIAINPSGAERGGNAVKKALSDIKNLATGVQGNMMNLASAMGRLPPIAGAVGVGIGVLVAAAVASAKATATYTAEIQKFGLATNLSTREAQVFASMARQSGMDIGGLSGGMEKLNQHLQDAAKGSGESQRLFGAPGVSVKDTNGQVRGTGKVFEEVIGKLGEFRNDGAKTTMISKLMGDEMQQMARIGKQGFQNLSNEARLMNAVLGEDSVKAAEKFNQHIARTGTILEAWKLMVGEKVLPVLNTVLEAMNKLATGRDLPGFGDVGTAGGAKALALPPDPNEQRQVLEQHMKERQLILARNFEVEKEEHAGLALDYQKSFEAREMTEKAYFASQAQRRLEDLSSEKRFQEQLLLLEVDRFLALQQLGGRSAEQRKQEEAEARNRVMEIQNNLGKNNSNTVLAIKESNIGFTGVSGKTQEELGQQITDRLISDFQIAEDLRHKDQDNALTYFQNLEKFQDAYGTTRENQLKTKYDLVRAHLAKELDVTNDTAAKVLNAWRNGDHTRAQELIGNTKYTWEQTTAIMFEHLAKQREVSKQFSDDMLSGFADSLHRYVNDQSMFGLGADQARSVAQAMQGAFKQHFFDGLKGEVTSLKDVIGGLVDFTQNILADVSSKLMTRMVLGGIDQLMSGFGGGGGIPSGGFNAASLLGIEGFARGGITSGLSLAGEAGPEAIVPLPNGRSIPVEWRGMPYGSPGQMLSTHAPQVNVPVQIEIRNEVNGADVQAEHRQRPDGSQQIEIVVKNIVKQGFKNGEFDPMMRQSFGTRRQPARRG